MRWVGFFVASLVVVGCSSSTPATTPTSIPTTATTTTLATTTTVDRVVEIEAILQSLEQRRIDAVYQDDRDAYRALFANEGFMEASMVVFDELEFDPPPVVEVEVQALLHDGAECVAARRVLHRFDLDQAGEFGNGVAVGGLGEKFNDGFGHHGTQTVDSQELLIGLALAISGRGQASHQAVQVMIKPRQKPGRGWALPHHRGQPWRRI